MTNDRKYLQSDEDVDFMPIIPLNDGEGDDAEDTVIPEDMPILPLRNTVLFPGVVIPITVGRDKSIKAVNEAYKGDKLVGVLAQKDSDVEDPGIEDLVKVGTIAKIIKLIRMPDGGTTVIIQGKRRFELQQLVSEEPYFRARVAALEETVVENDRPFDATVSSIKDLATQIIQLSPNIPTVKVLMVGGRLATATWAEDVAASPSVSVTVTRTRYAPLSAKVCSALAPVVSGVPSPQLQV